MILLILLTYFCVNGLHAGTAGVGDVLGSLHYPMSLYLLLCCCRSTAWWGMSGWSSLRIWWRRSGLLHSLNKMHKPQSAVPTRWWWHCPEFSCWNVVPTWCRKQIFFVCFCFGYAGFSHDTSLCDMNRGNWVSLNPGLFNYFFSVYPRYCSWISTPWRSII